MKTFSMPSRRSIKISFKRSLILIFVGGFFLATSMFSIQPAVADEAAFAADVPDQQGIQKGMKPGDAQTPKEKCSDDPVACAGVDVSQFPFPGCTSGQRCTSDTTGKPCGMFGANTRCQTVNNNGACSCKCVQ